MNCIGLNGAISECLDEDACCLHIACTVPWAFVIDVEFHDAGPQCPLQVTPKDVPSCPQETCFLSNFLQRDSEFAQPRPTVGF